MLRQITIAAGCEVAPREQAKDKHVARQTGARILNIVERLLWNDSNGVAVKNREILAGKETSVKLTKDYVKTSADIESASPAENWQLQRYQVVS